MKGQITIRITEQHTEEEHEALKEILNSPMLHKRSVEKLEQMIAEIFETDVDNVIVDIKAIEQE